MTARPDMSRLSKARTNTDRYVSFHWKNSVKSLDQRSPEFNVGRINQAQP
uniref:Uncharacterized protein n=1 Tax=Pseudomonas khorasanensis TaxID=2745508 RepID=A0A923JEL7_9PSED